jgi:hypothetical protein
MQTIVDVSTRIGPKRQTAIDQIILNNGPWEYSLIVIETGLSDHKAQLQQVQKNKKGQCKLKEEFRIAKSYREKNAPCLNYLLGKETGEPIFEQNSVNGAYNEFLGTFQYYHNTAIPKKWIKI